TNSFSFAEDYFVRYPNLNSDGTKITFSYQGDIWVKSLTGEGTAQRLTIHEGYEMAPVWSPDDKNIAFVSDRYGNNDVFTIKATGSNPTRLTHHSGSDNLSGWKSNSELLFTSSRSFVQVEREDAIYQVSTEGETPQRIMNSVGLMPKMSPDKRFIAFVKGGCRIEREGYKGPANKDIWIYDTENDEYIQITDYKGNDFLPKWTDNNDLYFISSRTGKYNIHKVGIDNEGNAEGSTEEITNSKDDGIRYFDISNDGSVLTFEKGIDIFVRKAEDKEARKLAFNLTKDNRYVPVKHKTYSRQIKEYELSPNGKYTAFVVRGELFLINNKKKKSRTVRLTDHPFRDHDIDWVNDSSIVFVSDRGGQKDIYLLQSTDEDEKSLYESLEINAKRISKTSHSEQSLNVSPDGSKIAFVRDRGQLIVADINTEEETLENEKTLLDGWATPSDITWSPDSKWLAYSLEDLYFNSEIYIHAADDSREPVNVSMHPKGDHSPYWSPDGKKLGFISERNNNDSDLWFAWLKKEDWQKTREDWEEMDDEEEEKKENGDEKEDEVSDVQIDFENIHERLSQVTALPGNESNILISEDGKTFYFVANRDSRQTYDAEEDLYSIKWDGKDLTRLTENNQNPYALEIDHKSGNIYMIKNGGSLAKLNTKKPKLKPVPVKAEMTINYPEEFEQIFEEGWSIIKESFYDPNHHGVNWKELKKKYKDYAMKASTKRDFRDMFNLMLGQINASHMGLYGDDMAETEDEKTGLLGLEVTPHDQGAEIKHIVQNSPADKSFSKLEEGEIITNINGNKLTKTSNFYAYLANKAGEEIYMEVIGKNGERRKVTIRPTESTRQNKYKEWVEERKELTEEYSNGKLGYIHIQGMNWPSFERFERELTASGYGKEGIVIDVRFNGGGWTTDYLMSVLNVRQHAYTVPRGATDNLEKNHENFSEYYPYSERLPLSAWTKPSIAMCNESSYSNAEIFSHAYKTLDLGKLVGKPTFGAVISTGGSGLIDNSYIRVPFRGWYVKETKENMEHGPAVPDILIDNQPDSKAKNEDPQLKKAVNELLEQIEDNE
ncbi:MAG: S41 family peptidase, partial [Bacteroidota bacterium]